MSAEQPNSQEEIPKQNFPEWINAKLFVGVLKEIDSEFQEIIKFKVDNALAPGENYVSVMLKVDILMQLKDNRNKQLSLMLKVDRDRPQSDDDLENPDSFSVEQGMYRDVVPEFEDLYAKAGKTVHFCAKSYQLQVNKPYLLLENLKLQGFRNVSRLDGLDMQHTECVLQKLAMWHAASAVRVANKGPYDKKYLRTVLSDESYDDIKRMFDNSTKTLLECAKDYGNSSIYYEQLCKLQPQVVEVLYEHVEADPQEFNVLNHGDLWTNNIMFQYDNEGKLQETILIDYQIPMYSTPAFDLLCFILTSVKLDIKFQKFDHIIKYYHDQLIENLKLLKYPKVLPTLKEIHSYLFKYGIFGYTTAVSLMGVVLCDPTENASMDNFLGDNEDALKFKRLMYSNARYRKNVEAIFPWLLYRGALEC